jgi:hypothetical protein
MTTAHKIACAYCGSVFQPQRRSARFCGGACRKRASRGAATAATNGTSAFVSVTGTPHISEAIKPALVTLRRPKTLPRGIVADAQWPGMYRLRLRDGRLSDMLNLTRAKDRLAAIRVEGSA